MVFAHYPEDLVLFLDDSMDGESKSFSYIYIYIADSGVQRLIGSNLHQYFDFINFKFLDRLNWVFTNKFVPQNSWLHLWSKSLKVTYIRVYFFRKVLRLCLLTYKCKHKCTHCLNVHISKWISSVKYCRSIHRMCSVKKDGLKNIPSYTGKQLCWSLFLIFSFYNFSLLKRNSNTGVFLWNLPDF